MFRCTIPEGVEIKISKELIEPLVKDKFVGKLILGNSSRYKSIEPEGFKDFNDSFRKLEDIGYIVSEMKVTGVSTKGKFMYWSFNNDQWFMFVTFGMSGQLSPTPGKHICLDIRLYSEKNISHIYFNDPRHFGTIKFTSNRQDLLDKLNELGWDPLQDKLDVYSKYLISEIQKSNKPICQLLMDQSLFAGVGNYIKAESLYKAKISPWRQGNLMSKEDVLNLCQSVIDVMQESYEHQGATLHTYKDAYGNEGQYSSCFKVYDQKLDPLNNKIIREKTPDGRTTHWCPTIQK